MPSDSPHATAIGGTAILNLVGGTGTETVGWRDTVTYISLAGVFDPHEVLSLVGGGESLYFAKLSWQKSLPGTGRQTLDISALADPYTGVPIVLTNGTQLAGGH